MRISSAQLEQWGYRTCGSVQPVGTPLRFAGSRGQGLFVVDVPLNVSGWVTYVHVMDDEFMKCGSIKPSQSLRERMRGSYNCLRKPIDLMNRGLLQYVGETLYVVDPLAGEPREHYREDFPWKHRVPPAMLGGRSVVLWAKAHDNRASMESEETKLNLDYRGEWAKEGWSDLRAPDGRPERRRILPAAHVNQLPG